MPILLRNALHLGAISSFAIAWQYFEALRGEPDFFIERGATSLDLVVFALGFVLLPPAILVLLEWLAGLVDERLRDALQLAFVTVLVALIVWQAVIEAAPTLPGAVRNVIALGVGAVGALTYAHFQVARSYLTLLSPAPLLVLALFVVFSPLRPLVFSGDGPEPQAGPSSGAPVVMVLFDELPTPSLMDRRSRIDPVAYGSFARLANDATWYRNAASVGDFTQLAVPAILAGSPATPGDPPIAAEHPRNLFTWLGGNYRLDVFEGPTDLCEEPVCPVQRGDPFTTRMRRIASDAIERIGVLPPAVRTRVADLTTPAGPTAPQPPERAASVRRLLPATQDVRYERFLQTLRPSRGHTLNFMHVLLPHRPWLYLPTGQKYRSTRAITNAPFGPLPRDRWVRDLAYQRHLAQVGYADLLLGRLLRRLRELRIYDRALIVVAADHGAAFRPGDEGRVLTRSNAAEVASVPLLVKAPGQRRGRIHDGYVETTDVLPTMARELRAPLPWPVEGRDAASSNRERPPIRIFREDGGGSVTVARADLERERDAALRRKLAIFGSGKQGPGLYGIGPRPDLLGRRLAELRPVDRRRLTVVLDDPQRFQSVDPRRLRLPADIGGSIEGSPRRRAIAVAVNGRVMASAWTLVRNGEEFFTSLVPPSAFRRGRNRVLVVAVRR